MEFPSYPPDLCPIRQAFCLHLYAGDLDGRPADPDLYDLMSKILQKQVRLGPPTEMRYSPHILSVFLDNRSNQTVRSRNIGTFVPFSFCLAIPFVL